ncbi:hypothetical protein QBC37DRAFT_423497 [Rhypophila decipiens]|uniref:2EXR domain-containing protein n=1 Tax=Rhypophila decipiens TaxID=261697 RepID=A0AAN6Y8B2_9PEZI|nr:hypothetical protein QBC37DRAFT_423497 [Rhypophila decipiens]
MAATFTPFPRLPIEIQDAIWTVHLLLQPPNPETCIISPPVLKHRPHEPGYCNPAYALHSQGQRRCNCLIGNGPILPLTVDTCWPAIAHLSRSSRSFFFRSTKSGLFKSVGIPIGLRLSPQAGNIHVPYRVFDPEVDTLYWSACQHDFITSVFFRQPEHAVLGRQLRHVAIELGVVFIHRVARPHLDYLNFPRHFIQHVAPLLESITYVLPESHARRYDCFKKQVDESENAFEARRLNHYDNSAPWVPGLEFVPPARRCRLTKLSDDKIMKIELDRVPGDILARARRAGFFRERLSADGPEGHDVFRRWLTMEEYMIVEPRRNVQGTRVDVQMAVFEERQVADVGRDGTEVNDERGSRESGLPERWVEVCAGRMVANLGLESRVGHVLTGERKDPEQYRVLDDDLGRFGNETL